MLAADSVSSRTYVERPLAPATRHVCAGEARSALAALRRESGPWPDRLGGLPFAPHARRRFLVGSSSISPARASDLASTDWISA